MLDDNTALDAICTTLDGEEWSPDTLEAIARIVRLTGRVIRDPEELHADTANPRAAYGEEC